MQGVCGDGYVRSDWLCMSYCVGAYLCFWQLRVIRKSLYILQDKYFLQINKAKIEDPVNYCKYYTFIE